MTEIPQTQEEVLDAYRAQQAQHEGRLAVIGKQRSRALQALVVVAVATFIIGSRAPHAGQLWLLMLGFAAGAGLLWTLARVSGEATREQRLISLYERSLRRADGTERQSGRTGLEAGQTLRTEGHLYERDLDLLGPDSLFGLLCTVRTGAGRARSGEVSAGACDARRNAGPAGRGAGTGAANRSAREDCAAGRDEVPPDRRQRLSRLAGGAGAGVRGVVSPVLLG